MNLPDLRIWLQRTRRVLAKVGTDCSVKIQILFAFLSRWKKSLPVSNESSRVWVKNFWRNHSAQINTKRTNNFPKNVPELKSPPSIIRGDSYDFTSNTIVMIEWSQLLCLPVKSLFKLIDCLWSVSAVPEAEGSYLDCQVKRTCKNTILKSLFTISVAIDLFAHNCVDKSK